MFSKISLSQSDKSLRLFDKKFDLLTILCFSLFPDDKTLTLSNWKSFQTTILNLMKMAESSQKGLKTLWEKEKMLVTSNFFSHHVFKRPLLQTSNNKRLYRKGLKCVVWYLCDIVKVWGLASYKIVLYFQRWFISYQKNSNCEHVFRIYRPTHGRTFHLLILIIEVLFIYVSNRREVHNLWIW